MAECRAIGPLTLKSAIAEQDNFAMSQSAGDYRTSPTLLGRLRNSPDDQAAWAEFVDRYGVVVYRWCRKWGLQDMDAEDVTQNVMLDLGRQMRQFEYRADGRFRGWLRTVAHRAWCDFLTGAAASHSRLGRHRSGGNALVDSPPATSWSTIWTRNASAKCSRRRCLSSVSALNRTPGRRFT